jgi:hypothetical protein
MEITGRLLTHGISAIRGDSHAVIFVFTAIIGSLFHQSNYYSPHPRAMTANRVNTKPIDTTNVSSLLLFSFRWIFRSISFLFL